MAFQHRHFTKVEWAQAIDAGHIHPVLGWNRASRVKRVDAAQRAKIVLRLPGVELIERQFVGAFVDVQILEVGRDCDGAAHAAVRAVASASAAEPIGQS